MYILLYKKCILLNETKRSVFKNRTIKNFNNVPLHCTYICRIYIL
jgi:hypothetical protein